MNTFTNSYATAVRQNRVSKKRNVIGLYNTGRSISLNQLNTDYVDQWYKEQYLMLKERHEHTKQQFNKQQAQLKQLNCRLQRLLQEKKDFLSQFVHYDQVNAGYLVEELEMTNLRLEKENEKLKDQLLLAQVRAKSANVQTNLGRVMIINMRQHLQTNYGWVKPRIDSGLSDQTKRNPISGQLVRQNKMMNGLTNLDRKHEVKRSIGKLTNNRPKINKERHRVSFSNQLEQEHLYEDDFELEDEVTKDWSSEDSSNEEEARKSSVLERRHNESDDSEKLSAIDGLESSDRNWKQFKNQLNKAKAKIKKLEEIVFLQQRFIDRQQELVNQTDHAHSSRDEVWQLDKENIQSNTSFDTNYSNLSSNSSLTSSSSRLPNDEFGSMRTAGGNELQIEELNESNASEQSNKIRQIEADQLVSTNYGKNKNTRKQLSKANDGIDPLLGETIDKKTPESTNSIFGDEDSSSSLSSLDQFALSALSREEKEDRTGNSKAKSVLENLSKQLEVEKIRNEQLENQNRSRLRELEQNVDELSKENEILRNSLEKCIQDCLSEIGGSGLG